MNSDLKNNTFIGFLDPKNVGKEVWFIILAFFVILQYISSGHFEKTAKKHVFTPRVLLGFFLVISKTPRRQNQQKSFSLEFFPLKSFFVSSICWHVKDTISEQYLSIFYFNLFLVNSSTSLAQESKRWNIMLNGSLLISWYWGQRRPKYPI